VHFSHIAIQNVQVLLLCGLIPLPCHYYGILKSKLKKDLEPAGTRERQIQISAFIMSESNSFYDTSKLGIFGSVLKKAADCVLKAEMIISAATQSCLPASIACMDVMLVLSISSLLRLYMLDADV
jgi:hypothetical protein